VTRLYARSILTFVIISASEVTSLRFGAKTFELLHHKHLERTEVPLLSVSLAHQASSSDCVGLSTSVNVSSRDAPPHAPTLIQHITFLFGDGEPNSGLGMATPNSHSMPATTIPYLHRSSQCYRENEGLIKILCPPPILSFPTLALSLAHTVAR
jgi:hypothetical protein